MSKTAKKAMARGLAWRIAVAFESVDPYSFDDAYESTQNAAFCILELLKEDPETVLDDLSAWIADAWNDSMEKALSALRRDVEEYAAA